MGFSQEFIPLELDQLHREAAVLKTEGWRFIQTHAVNTEDGIDLYYSFMRDGKVANYRIAGVKKDQAVPSITDLFLAAFVFENEARELFGVDMRDIAIDFAGAMYAPAQSEPMTFISPEQKAAREKAKKVASAKAAKEAAGDANASKTGATPPRRIFIMTPERQARLDAKMATMSPEKKAKVEAALKARAAEAAAASGQSPVTARPENEPAASAEQGEQRSEDPQASPSMLETAEAAVAAKDSVLEEKLAGMDPAKAAKVRAALQGKAKAADKAGVAVDAVSADEPPADMFADEQLNALIGLMDDTKASVVRAALNMKGGE